MLICFCLVRKLVCKFLFLTVLPPMLTTMAMPGGPESDTRTCRSYYGLGRIAHVQHCPIAECEVHLVTTIIDDVELDSTTNDEVELDSTTTDEFELASTTMMRLGLL